MAEFVEVMKQARRMCESIDDCTNCPLLDASIECPKEYNDSDFIQHEAAIMKWSAEHPELRYPTWREWQQEHFPDAGGWMRPCNFISFQDAGCMNHTSCQRCAEWHIPADIAQKLGIKPIPVEPQETLVDEYERLRDRAENLNLYLNKLREAEPWVFECVKSKMDGMPGYLEVKTE